MKKIVVIFIIVYIICISLFQVFAEQNTIMLYDMKLTLSKYNNEVDFDKSDDVAFYTEHDMYDKEVKEIKYIFENHTNMKVSYGHDAELEMFVNGQWYEINLKRGIDDVAMILNSNTKREDVFQWNIEGYDLPEGKYRIIKQLSDRTYGKLGVFGERKYCAEFEISNTKNAESDTNTVMWCNIELQPSKYNETDFDKSGSVVFQTEHNVYAEDIEEITYIFKNQTAKELKYGYDTEVEVFINEKWYEIPRRHDRDDAGISLNFNKKRAGIFRWSVAATDWDIREIDLPKGKYRLIKQVSDSDNSYGEYGFFGKRKYYAEFEIGKSIYTKYSPYGYEKLQRLPKEYTKKIAIKNDDVVLIEGGETENTENIKKFIENVDLGIPAFLRMTRYLKNGDILITEVEYTKGKYIYRYDSTRTQKDIGIIKKEYPYMITDGNNVYLSNWSNWEYKQKYQGEAGEHLFSKANGECAMYAVEEVKHIMEKYSQGSTVYRIKIKDQEYYFSEQTAIEQVLKLEKRKGHINIEITDIIWHDNGEFLIKVVSEDRKEGYTTVYKLYE
ncbi:immunoglobulin-like domain-containing protein [Clostridium sp. MD294]|uniref:immunoglobulin-like domain-containing protein n=1 Tax=Clostridium sp. MD294 TaxID=97138 RepID=UPI0002C8E63E|nr:immunoglobulin-like domain-containing protein [Clostridium sp. MD294]NDO46051.1 DUF4362 domain-containing protein [Clostridium sp. MD294]USF30285.1 hypothetical protein C820_001726 [Clostridium sp. MD294]